MGFFESKKPEKCEKTFPVDWDSVTTFEDLKGLVKIACAAAARSSSYKISIRESGFDDIPELKKICVGTQEHRTRIGVIPEDKLPIIENLQDIQDTLLSNKELWHYERQYMAGKIMEVIHQVKGNKD